MNLPAFVEPHKLCDTQQEIQGQIELAKLPGLCSYLQSDAGDVFIRLQFQRNYTSYPLVTGQISTNDLPMICQRCLNLAAFQLQVEVNLAIVSLDQQLDELPVKQDFWILNEERIELVELIDHELMLNLPIIAYHPNCKVQTDYGNNTAMKSEIQINPFSALRQLLSKD